MTWGRIRLVALALILVANVAMLASPVKADAVDPAIGVRGGGGGSTLWGSGNGTGSTTILFAPTTAGVTCLFGICTYTTPSNNPFFITSGSITDFQFSFNQSQFIGFSIFPGSQFNTLTVQNGVNSPNPIAFLSGGTILPAPTCTICLLSSTATSSSTIVGDFLLTAFGVVQGTSMTITSNVPLPVPEPASIGLVLAGLGALGARKLRRSAKEKDRASELGA